MQIEEGHQDNCLLIIQIFKTVSISILKASQTDK